MSLQLLIIEDEKDLADLIADYALAAGYRPKIIGDGLQALEAVRARMPDFIVLDLMLPSLDGLSFCQELRRFSQVPVIMVTAKVEEIDRLIGLETGADDYLCKPFSPRELMARIKTIWRRFDAKDGATSQAGQFVIDDAKHLISINNTALELTRTEYLLLTCFVRHPGQIFSRTQLLDFANQDSLDVTDRAIDTHIKNLRRKLDLALPDVDAIHSIYGLGYRFEL